MVQDGEIFLHLYHKLIKATVMQINDYTCFCGRL